MEPVVTTSEVGLPDTIPYKPEEITAILAGPPGWRPLMAEDPDPPKDAKTVLLEWAQSKGLPLPEYKVIAQKGPAHAPLFTVEATLHGIKPASGQGASKQVAEQEAAGVLLKRIEAKG